MDRRLALQCLVAGTAVPGVAYSQAQAQAQTSGASAYPDHPINLVIPFPPGGLADSVGRMISLPLETILGQPLVAVNRAGAAGALGTASVVNARADGYTLLMALSSISTLPEQSRVNNQKPPFLLNQLKPVARITTDPMALVVAADSTYKDIGQLLADAKARPGMVAYGSSGVYGTVHVPAEMFAHAAGVKLNHVPYTGGAPLMQALLGKQLDLTFLPRSSILQYLRAGKIRALAVMGSQRWSQLPDVPSMHESGLDVDYLPWTGLLAPEGISDAVFNKLRIAVAQAASSPAFKAQLDKAGGTLAYMDAPEFQKFWSAEIGRLNEVIKRIGKTD